MRISDWSSDVCSSDLKETSGLGPMGTRSLRRPVVYSAYRAIALGEHRPPATPLSQRKVLLFRATVAASPQAATEGRQQMVQLPPRPSHGFVTSRQCYPSILVLNSNDYPQTQQTDRCQKTQPAA